MDEGVCTFALSYEGWDGTLNARCVAFLSNTRAAIGGLSDVCIFSVPGGALLRHINVPTSSVIALAVSPNQQFLAIGDVDGSVLMLSHADDFAKTKTVDVVDNRTCCVQAISWFGSDRFAVLSRQCVRVFKWGPQGWIRYWRYLFDVQHAYSFFMPAENVVQICGDTYRYVTFDKMAMCRRNDYVSPNHKYNAYIPQLTSSPIEIWSWSRSAMVYVPVINVQLVAWSHDSTRLAIVSTYTSRQRICRLTIVTACGVVLFETSITVNARFLQWAPAMLAWSPAMLAWSPNDKWVAVTVLLTTKSHKQSVVRLFNGAWSDRHNYKCSDGVKSRVFALMCVRHRIQLPLELILEIIAHAF